MHLQADNHFPIPSGTRNEVIFLRLSGGDRCAHLGFLQLNSGGSRPAARI